MKLNLTNLRTRLQGHRRAAKVAGATLALFIAWGVGHDAGELKGSKEAPRLQHQEQMSQKFFPCAEDEVLGFSPEFGPDKVGCLHVSG
jgi:hypothetical protein